MEQEDISTSPLPITLEKMADLSRGDVIVGNASNRPSAVNGSDEQVLTTDSNGDAVWANPIGPGGIEFSFNTAIGDANKDDGDLWANNETLSSATELYIDDKDRHGNSIVGWRDTLDEASNATGNYGHLIIKKKGTTQLSRSSA